MKSKYFLLFLMFFSIAGLKAQWHRYAMTDSASTTVTQAVVIQILKNDSLNPSPKAYNYIANPVACDYPFLYGTLKSEHGGTLSFMNEDSVLYTPPGNYAGMDQFVYAICNHGQTYQVDSARVYITITGTVSANGVVLQNQMKVMYIPEQELVRFQLMDGQTASICNLRVTDLQGRLVHELGTSSRQVSMATEKLAPGVYCYTILLSDNTRIQGKLVVNR